MKHPLAWLSLQGLLLALGLVSLVWNLLALVLYPVLSRAVGRRVGRAVISASYRCFWRVAGATGLLRMDARALDGLADEPGLIIIANHPSLLDAMMLVARLPRSFCLMKASLMRNPLLGPGAMLAGYIRNDSALGLVRRAVVELREGGQLVMFPEGTRTTRHPINPLQPGITLIASRAGAPIQTVFIQTDSPYLSKGWPIWRLPPLPIRFEVRLGERFAPVADGATLLRQLEAHFVQGLRRAAEEADR
jgi:1-acyl-sn-glycerol-3-phosphate acyltransferase